MSGYSATGHDPDTCAWSTQNAFNTCSNSPTSYSCRDTCESSGNMYLTEDYNCVCAEHWSGTNCSLYSGPCSDGCGLCDGPTRDDCLKCRDTAETNNRIAIAGGDGCYCKEGYVGYYCESYIGECAGYCNNCSGEDAD
jgi:hypothetical protein